jgi:hypothetical protein
MLSIITTSKIFLASNFCIQKKENLRLLMNMLGGNYTFHSYKSTIFVTSAFWDLLNISAMYINGGENFTPFLYVCELGSRQRVGILNIHKISWQLFQSHWAKLIIEFVRMEVTCYIMFMFVGNEFFSLLGLIAFQRLRMNIFTATNIKN